MEPTIPRLDRTDADFVVLCWQASQYLSLYGMGWQLCDRFLNCKTSSEFNRLCYDLEEWDNTNPHGDLLLSLLMDIRRIKGVVDVMVEGTDDTP